MVVLMQPQFSSATGYVYLSGASALPCGCWSEDYFGFMLRLTHVRELAEHVLGTGKLAHQWLKSGALGLGNQVPVCLLSDACGFHEVVAHLLRIEYGTYC